LPFAKEWEDLGLDKAMEMIADRVWENRERTFVESQDGLSLMQTKAIAHLGGATLDNDRELAHQEIVPRWSGNGVHF
jgi:formate dehydrogenase major subunit